jgi:hypothetical protein
VKKPLVPDSYPQFLAELKNRIRATQIRASLAVNRELVLLYWQIGRDILDRQERESWGAQLIDRVGFGPQTFLSRHEGILTAQPEIRAAVC